MYFLDVGAFEPRTNALDIGIAVAWRDCPKLVMKVQKGTADSLVTTAWKVMVRFANEMQTHGALGACISERTLQRNAAFN